MLKKGNLLFIAAMSLALNAHSQGSAPEPFSKTLEERVSDLEKDIANIKKHGKFEDVALDKANADTKEVSSWAQDKILEIYSYNFMNYDDVIKYIKNFFTQPGYDSYLKALQDSKNRDILQSQKLIVHAIPAGGAVIEHEGVVDGIYEWIVKVPLLVTYSNANGTIDRKLDVDVVVTRLPYSESERGYGIHAIRAKETAMEPVAPAVTTPKTNLTPKIEAPKTSEKLNIAK